MTRRLRPFLALAALAGGLAGCGDNSNTTTPVVPPAPVATTESKFGACFATRYDAPANSKATDPVPCPDLPPVSATTTPNNI